MSRAVLIIGGGITGMQAALDVANAGFEVILVERTPTIGGHMLQFSEVFPTLDCPQCIGTPKMVEVGYHPNIELMAYSEVVSVTGSAGKFKVKIKRKPRYIDVEKCTACGECARVCPVSLPDEWNLGINTRKAVYIPFPQAVPAKYTIDKRERRPCKAACKAACPISTNVQGYLALIEEGKFQEAYELIRRSNPLPSVCGRVCHHPCEEVCNRGQVDDALSIAALKRFAADQADIKKLGIPQITKVGKRVAIIGSGPAGLAAANDLALLGYDVTIFEALPEPGGMLRVGIPEYRLPRDVLRQEIEYIERLGVEIKTNTKVGEQISLDELRQSYDAVFIATGAHQSLTLNIPGVDIPGVLLGVSFLRDASMGHKIEIGQRVAVIGGGNVAIDVALTALRLGAEEVQLVCLESREEMPAFKWGIQEAVDEGVILNTSWGPKRILGNGKKVTGIELVRCTSVFDDKGKFNPSYDESVTTSLDADTVIVAIGQASDLSFLGDSSGIESTTRGLIVTDNSTLETKAPGIFAGGDAVTGPKSVIDAIAAGKNVARSIDNYLKGEPPVAEEEKGAPEKLSEDEIAAIKERFPSRSRVKMAELEPQERVRGFSEVELGYTIEEAQQEAGRCLASQIEGCFECYECEAACDAKAINHEAQEEYEEREVGAIIVATGYDVFDARLKPEYGYGIYPNVITGFELERLDQAGGPTSGKVEINGKEPKNVVFIQCVGSRDKSVDCEYCSRICCMATTKQAWYIKHKIPDAKITVCYIDIRAFGKGYEEFYERVQGDGVIYRRGIVSEVYKKGDKLIVRAEDTLLGEVYEEEADLVVLATGLRPRQDAIELAEMLNISKGSDGFFLEAHPKLGAVESGVDGIYLAGCCQGPKDIADSVVQASAAAAMACIALSKVEKEAVKS